MAGNNFDVVIELETQASRIRCRGELDISTAARLDDAFDKCLARRPRTVLLDCSDVTFVDSSGIRCLVKASRRLKEDEISLRIELSEPMQKVVDVLGVGPALGV